MCYVWRCSGITVQTVKKLKIKKAQVFLRNACIKERTIDATYDVASAGQKLEQIAMKRAQGDDGSYQLSAFMQNEHLQQNIRVIKYERPTTWQLIYEGNGHANAEEVVLRIQGVIAQKDLPPLTNKPK
ncbi:hypothetical protein PILCRDRAFT_899 [Piloderma croceum F 1598]|uniref:Uncharacterized protein n=1 Tax=Piloderma croceum (strain F 1598) TaxID=765440 RepID=A0A0C3BZ04_PILCF|nr:hypothetical protein PILCRDRAFT_899 [Piloderma croceum F 1598]